MSYTHTTFAQAKTALLTRLGDTGGVYWTDTECGLYIIEALQTWGLLTGYWRDTGTFNTVASTPFYDISTLTNTGAESLLSYTTVDSDLTTLIQYHLLEPATGTTWTGSEQFTLTDVTDALTKRRNAFLTETGCRQTLSTQLIGAGSRTFDLPETTLRVDRIDWTGVSGTSWPLVHEDINSQRNYSDSYLITADIPQTYSSGTEAPLRYIIAPPPNEVGTLRTLSVISGATLTSQGVIVGVPDDMCWAIKWGVLADLLGREGPGQDLTRSYFCERRYRLGIELSKVQEVIIDAEINGVSLSPSSINSLDNYNPNWPTSAGTSTFIAGYHNYVALAPVPSGIMSVLLNVVRKAVIPSASGDFIQVGPDYLDIIIDYSEHLASFKCGGMEFRHTFRAADNFFKAALSYNQRLAATNPAILALLNQSSLDDAVTPPERRTYNRPLEQEAYSSPQRGNEP